jgi:4-hydroxybenzoate polyprenyltransferase
MNSGSRLDPRELAYGFTEFEALSPADRANAARYSTGRIGLAEQARTIIMLGRPRTCIPGVICYALGYTLVSSRISWYYCFGIFMVLVAGLLANLYNVCTDLQEDSSNLPGRVWLVVGMGYQRLRLATLILSAVVICAALAYSVSYAFFAAAVLVGVHQYSFPPLRLKARPGIDLLAFSLAVYGPFLLGYFGAKRAVPAPSTAAWLWVGFLVLWFAAKCLTKNIPDYAGDRDAGLRTSVTLFPSQRAAAIAAAAATLAAYASLPLFVVLGAAPLRVLAAIPWTAVAVVNSLSLITRSADRRQANLILKRDMWLSTAFIITVLLLSSPSWLSLIAIGFGAVVLACSDIFSLDSRRVSDVSGSEGTERSSQ